MGAAGEAGAVDDVAARKAAVRRTARSTRRALVSRRDLDADAERLAGHVLALVARRTAGSAGTAARVAAYASYGVEPPTNRLVARLRAAGHEVVLPVLLPDRSLDWEVAGGDGRPLGVGALAGAAVVVTPALAVDRLGTRLGQGGGSYDRALVHCLPDALVVTLLHDGELRGPADPLPRTALDVPVAAVVSADAGVVRLR